MKSAASVGLLALLATFEGSERADSLERDTARIAEHVRRGEWGEALAASDTALAQSAELELSEPELAELHFARGVILLSRELESEREPDPETPGGFQPAAGAFQAARALSGPGVLRLDATYDLGLVHFHEGERAREQIPEVSGAALPETDPAALDPLGAARAAYSEAKAVFVERLRADWRDEDTRANLELLQRRLKELDEIERQRQEEKEQEQEPQRQPSDEGQSGDEEQPSDGEPQEPQKDSEDPDAGKDQPARDQPPEGQPGEDQPRGGEQQPADPESAANAERRLTREQVLQLLDKLGELEKEAQALEAQIREARRVPVTRDW